jgi:phosphoglycolate phosphatase
MIGRFRLACLDMAGTTVRDDGAVEAAFTSALAAVGVTPGSRFYEEAEVVVHETMGWSKADVFARLFDADEAREATRAFAEAYQAIVAHGDVTKVCLTTGFDPPTRDTLLDALGWRAEIDLALSPADVGRGRPAPDLVFGAMAQLGVDDPEAVVVVGDTVSDLEAGHAAGAGAVVGVLSGAHDAATLEAASPTAVLDDVAGLVELLRLA